MMVADKNAKTSLFPRRSRPVAGHPTGRSRQPESHDERLIQPLHEWHRDNPERNSIDPQESV
ncbi:hypothetical protein ECSP_0843 [Escherichia coli O157:H7 str. TW14359]|nr:hypothetical protein ECSP_0843 [Escherichia coli O157:H7 str. TW14359]